MVVNKPICIIEDNQSIRKLYTILLKKNGFKVEEFEDGESALEWLSNNEALLVICDDSLPDTSGSEVLKRYRSFTLGTTTPVVAITGHAHISDRDKYLEIGFDEYITKPINVAMFVDQIRNVISQ